VGSTASTQSELVIGIGAFGVVLIIAGVWLYRQRRNRPEDDLEEEEEGAEADEAEVAAVQDTPDTLLDAIVALDDLYQAGQLPDAAYQQRRAELKARLKALKER
jgi:hypothetical protein